MLCHYSVCDAGQVGEGDTPSATLISITHTQQHNIYITQMPYISHNMNSQQLYSHKHNHNKHTAKAHARATLSRDVMDNCHPLSTLHITVTYW